MFSPQELVWIDAKAREKGVTLIPTAPNFLESIELNISYEPGVVSDKIQAAKVMQRKTGFQIERVGFNDIFCRFKDGEEVIENYLAQNIDELKEALDKLWRNI